MKDLSRFKKYVTIDDLTGETYTYKARFGNKQMPQVHRIMHLPKAAGKNCHYVAMVSDGTMLYSGKQTQDRMFRGDGLKGQNFHHKEMRDAGLIEVLQAGKTVTIYITEQLAAA